MSSTKILLLLLVLIFTNNIYGQDLSQAQRWIKIGNTLRETKQFKEAENYLGKGLDIVIKSTDRYWQAVAYENMGLLYRDKNDLTSASRYFKKALDIFRTTNTSTSAKALQQLYDGVSNNSVTNNNYIFGGIEIGSRGVKVSIIGIKLGPNGEYKFNQIFSSAINTSAAQCTPSALTETAKAVRILLDTLLNKNISKERIFIVGSSGLKNELEKPECGKKEELLNLVKQEVINLYQNQIVFIDVCQEAEMVMTGTINSYEWTTSAVIDIGSGNVKGGYFQNDKFECIDLIGIIPFVKYIQLQKKDMTFANAAQTIYKNDIGHNLIQPDIARRPGFQTKNKIYFIGGIIYAMTTYLHPDQFNKVEVSFTYSEVADFKRRAIEDFNNLIKPDISNIDDENLYKKLKEAIDKPVFNQEELIAGAVLLEGILTEVKKPILVRSMCLTEMVT